MPRKRKISEKVENATKDMAKQKNGGNKPKNSFTKDEENLMKLILNTQKGESQFKKSIIEVKKLFDKMNFDNFMECFFKIVLYAMHREENDEVGTNILNFCANFIAGFGEEPDTHPVIRYSFEKLLTITSPQAVFRMRLCQFIRFIINSFSTSAEIDDEIYETITGSMMDFIKDISPLVRVQAVLSLHRLQNPEDQGDVVTKAYQYHLEFDPSPKVRQAVMTSIAKNVISMNCIMDRLHDCDEKVRRHTYIQMSSYPVKQHPITHRLEFLECGLYDRSEYVRKAVCNIMLQNWIAAYEKKYNQFVAAIKLDSKEEDIQRFKKIAYQALSEIFAKESISSLVSYLDFPEDGEFKLCIPFESITMEALIVWKAIIVHFNNYMDKNGKSSDDMGLDENEEENMDESSRNVVQEIISSGEILPELSVMCQYITKFITESEYDKNDKFSKLNFNHSLLTLLEIVNLYDFNDEIGKQNLKVLLRKILVEYQLVESMVKTVIGIYERIIGDVEERLNYFKEVVTNIISSNKLSELSVISYADEIVKESTNTDLKLKVTELKLKIYDLVESETSYVQKKDYAEAQRLSDKVALVNEELLNLIKSYSENSTFSNSTQFELLRNKKLTQAEILKSLQIIFYGVTSKGVKSLTHEILSLHNDFIARHQGSMDLGIRIMALKASTACSMLYESIAKDTFNVLRAQLFNTTTGVLWTIAIECIFELIDRYGFEFLGLNIENDRLLNNTDVTKSKKSGRALYNDNDADEEEQEENDMRDNFPLMSMMFHILDTCNDIKIYKVLIIGIGRLVLHGHYITKDVVSKFLLLYFNPATEPEVNQLLGVFFENLNRNKMQECLQTALIKTVITLFKAPSDSPLREIKMENILRYVIDSTRPIYCSNGLNLHNDIALEFLQMINDNIQNKEVIKLFSKELLTLEISDDDIVLKTDLKAQCVKVIEMYGTSDPKTIKNIITFKQIVEGTYRPPVVFSSTATNFVNEERDPDADNEEIESGSENNDDLSENQETNQADKITSDEILQISPSKVRIMNVGINLTKHLSIVEEEEESGEHKDMSGGANGNKSLADKSENNSDESSVEDQNETVDHVNETTNQEPIEIPMTQTTDVEIPATQEIVEEPVVPQEHIEIPATQNFNDEEEVPPSPEVEQQPTRFRRAKRQLTDTKSVTSSPKVNSPLRKQMRVSSTPSKSSTKTPKRSTRGNITRVLSAQKSSRGKARLEQNEKSEMELPSTPRSTRKTAAVVGNRLEDSSTPRSTRKTPAVAEKPTENSTTPRSTRKNPTPKLIEAPSTPQSARRNLVRQNEAVEPKQTRSKSREKAVSTEKLNDQKTPSTAGKTAETPALRLRGRPRATQSVDLKTPEASASSRLRGRPRTSKSADLKAPETQQKPISIQQSANTRSTRQTPATVNSKNTSPAKEKQKQAGSSDMETPRDSNLRTRSRAIEEQINEKVLTRKSLSSLEAKSPTISRFASKAGSARSTRQRQKTK